MFSGAFSPTPSPGTRNGRKTVRPHGYASSGVQETHDPTAAGTGAFPKAGAKKWAEAGVRARRASNSVWDCVMECFPIEQSACRMS